MLLSPWRKRAYLLRHLPPHTYRLLSITAAAAADARLAAAQLLLLAHRCALRWLPPLLRTVAATTLIPPFCRLYPLHFSWYFCYFWRCGTRARDIFYKQVAARIAHCVAHRAARGDILVRESRASASRYYSATLPSDVDGQLRVTQYNAAARAILSLYRTPLTYFAHAAFSLCRHHLYARHLSRLPFCCRAQRASLLAQLLPSASFLYCRCACTSRTAPGEHTRTTLPLLPGALSIAGRVCWRLLSIAGLGLYCIW